MNDEEQQPATPAPEGEPQESHEKERDPPTHEHLEEALREKDQFRLMAQRAQADLINYKRRSAEEMDELRRAANSRLLTRVLSVVDDLDRALTHIPEDAVTPGCLGLAFVVGVGQGEVDGFRDRGARGQGGHRDRLRRLQSVGPRLSHTGGRCHAWQR